MNENKVTVTKEELTELIVKEVHILADDKGGALSTVLMGGVVNGFLCEELFAENESICVTKEEFVSLTASAISNFAKDEKAEKIATLTGLLAILIVGTIKDKLFSEERLEKERMLQVAKMLRGENEEVQK